MSMLENGIKELLLTASKQPDLLSKNPFATGNEPEIKRSIMDSVHSHSVGAAVSAVAAGLVPGASAVIATVISGGIIWKMYLDINSKLGIKFDKNAVQTVASAVGANVVQYVIGGILINVVLSFIPIINLLSCAALAAACYVAVYVSAYVYIMLLTNLFKAGKSVSGMSGNEMKTAAENIMNSINFKDIKEEGKQAHKRAEDAGEFKK